MRDREIYNHPHPLFQNPLLQLRKEKQIEAAFRTQGVHFSRGRNQNFKMGFRDRGHPPEI